MRGRLFLRVYSSVGSHPDPKTLNPGSAAPRLKWSSFAAAVDIRVGILVIVNASASGGNVFTQLLTLVLDMIPSLHSRLFLPAMNGYCLQLELLMTAWKSDMSDKNILRK